MKTSHRDPDWYGLPLLAANRQLHDAMTRLRIPHSFEEYDGDHTNRVRERVERHVLPSSRRTSRRRRIRLHRRLSPDCSEIGPGRTEDDAYQLGRTVWPTPSEVC